ncbi:WXG100 family type VII secretion target [Saccharomonospora cyanea]|uniref:WXG repeat protein n=1 Tax=Saccharomonospora cyanea NA-134 TaxID=882082 RepID=H5XCI9_9PSEU|nr:WXG100 family type VII secretion target [Saccharomonospora cyanea]EHR60204.1 hypothetical protein SaccyDRAFT_1295 [Saccharomonospora cyanea NA-134]
MGFRHPALGGATTSSELGLLAKAADTLGSPNPIQALRHVDCDPPAVAELAARLAESAEVLEDASADLGTALGEIGTGWSGAGHEAFAESAAAVQHRYKETTARTHDGAQGGAEVASTLDSLAGTVADRALSVAGGAAEASRRVLAGESGDSAEVVNEACRTIVLTVQDAVRSIGDLAGKLANHA